MRSRADRPRLGLAAHGWRFDADDPTHRAGWGSQAVLESIRDIEEAAASRVQQDAKRILQDLDAADAKEAVHRFIQRRQGSPDAALAKAKALSRLVVAGRQASGDRSTSPLQLGPRALDVVLETTSSQRDSRGPHSSMDDEDADATTISSLESIDDLPTSKSPTNQAYRAAATAALSIRVPGDAPRTGPSRRPSLRRSIVGSPVLAGSTSSVSSLVVEMPKPASAGLVSVVTTSPSGSRSPSFAAVSPTRRASGIIGSTGSIVPFAAAALAVTAGVDLLGRAGVQRPRAGSILAGASMLVGGSETIRKDSVSVSPEQAGPPELRIQWQAMEGSLLELVLPPNPPAADSADRTSSSLRRPDGVYARAETLLPPTARTTGVIAAGAHLLPSTAAAQSCGLDSETILNVPTEKRDAWLERTFRNSAKILREKRMAREVHEGMRCGKAPPVDRSRRFNPQFGQWFVGPSRWTLRRTPADPLSRPPAEKERPAIKMRRKMRDEVLHVQDQLASLEGPFLFRRYCQTTGESNDAADTLVRLPSILHSLPTSRMDNPRSALRSRSQSLRRQGSGVSLLLDSTEAF